MIAMLPCSPTAPCRRSPHHLARLLPMRRRSWVSCERLRANREIHLSVIPGEGHLLQVYIGVEIASSPVVQRGLLDVFLRAVDGKRVAGAALGSQELPGRTWGSMAQSTERSRLSLRRCAMAWYSGEPTMSIRL